VILVSTPPARALLGRPAALATPSSAGASWR
jgi:hypothetical protein